jgi:ribosomal protein L28
MKTVVVIMAQSHPRNWNGKDPGEGRFVRLTLSARGIKTVDKIGIEQAIARIRARGEKI